jgi:hypothetical protein
MKIRIMTIAVALALITSLSACKEEEGPMEKMGKKMDEAAEEVEDSFKDAADEVEDAVEDAADEIEDAADDAND